MSSKTLEPSPPTQGLVELKAAMYSYHPGDVSKLIASLKDGTFDSTKKKYTSGEIEDIRHSKRWNERFGAYLRKQIHSAEIIQHRIECWINKYASESDDAGRAVFTRDTVKVAEEQFRKVEYVADYVLDENDNTYHEIPAGPRSTHGLSKWKTCRPESHLEKFHELLAHFANSGMRAGLAVVLTLRGTCAWNVKCRWVETREKHQSTSNLPKYLEDIPPYQDHSLLEYLNQQADEVGIQRPFQHVTPIHEDNGERFLVDYFNEQHERNKQCQNNDVTKICLCNECRETCQWVRQGGGGVTRNDLPVSGDNYNENAVGGLLTTSEEVPAPNTAVDRGLPTEVLAGGTSQNSASSLPVPATTGGLDWNTPSSLVNPYFPFLSPAMTFVADQTGGCPACLYLQKRQMGKTLRGRPPNHAIYCSLSPNTLLST